MPLRNLIAMASTLQAMVSNLDILGAHCFSKQSQDVLTNALVTSSDALVTNSVLVTTSKALVSTSVALVVL